MIDSSHVLDRNLTDTGLQEWALLAPNEETCFPNNESNSVRLWGEYHSREEVQSYLIGLVLSRIFRPTITFDVLRPEIRLWLRDRKSLLSRHGQEIGLRIETKGGAGEFRKYLYFEVIYRALNLDDFLTRRGFGKNGTKSTYEKPWPKIGNGFPLEDLLEHIEKTLGRIVREDRAFKLGFKGLSLSRDLNEDYEINKEISDDLQLPSSRGFKRSQIPDRVIKEVVFRQQFSPYLPSYLTEYLPEFLNGMVRCGFVTNPSTISTYRSCSDQNRDRITRSIRDQIGDGDINAEHLVDVICIPERLDPHHPSNVWLTAAVYNSRLPKSRRVSTDATKAEKLTAKCRMIIEDRAMNAVELSDRLRECYACWKKRLEELPRPTKEEKVFLEMIRALIMGLQDE